MAGPRVSDMVEANRTLRFAKECVDGYELRFHHHKPFRLTVIDCKRLTRVCRSSLAAETQAAATAVDELEWVKTFWQLMIFPEAEAGSFVITDAKSLYDAANSMSAGRLLY